MLLRPKMKQERLSAPSFLKLSKFNVQLHYLPNFFFFLILASGLLIAITLFFYLSEFSFNFQIHQFLIRPSLGFTPSPPVHPRPPVNSLPNSTINAVNSSSSSSSFSSSSNQTTETTTASSNRHRSTKPISTRQEGHVDDDHGPKDLSKLRTKGVDKSEQELLWRASRVPRIEEVSLRKSPKVAFMFLTRGPVLMAPLWERFFKGVDKDLYSIYVHSPPSFKQTLPATSVFYGRNIPSKVVKWGASNMIEAERRLLANALLDLSNQRFVLLSESCIPLFNFSTIYTYLISSTETYVEAYDLRGATGRGRYKHRMRPLVKLSQWRKGSQWFQIDRALAIEVVSDGQYFPMFQRYCRGSCYGDEHYLPTFVSIKFWNTNANRTLTWVDWSKGGAHPTKFMRMDITNGFLEKLRHGTTCVYNGNITNVCHLFARKFSPQALDRLLRFAPKIMHFN